MSNNVNNLSIAGFPRDEDVSECENMAPLIRNCWYVIAEIDQVDRNLKSIEALGQPLVYFRGEDGEPIVLDDRCAHRRYSLSKGALIGDNIQCGYHGFTYNKMGRCVKAPGFNRELGFGVRKYPSKEFGPWLWVWMGEPEKADPSLIPLEDGGWNDAKQFKSYVYNPGNYMLLVENLLDLTHIPYLHSVAGTSEEWGDVKLSAIDVSNGVGWEKNVDKEQASEIAKWTGGNPEQWVKSYTNSRQIGPSFNDSVNIYSALNENDPPANPGELYIAHAVTPKNLYGTHQFSLFRMDKPLVVPAEQLRHLFEEIIYKDDTVAIEVIQSNLDKEDREGRLEFGTTFDRFGVKMRKILLDLKKKETHPVAELITNS